MTDNKRNADQYERLWCRGNRWLSIIAFTHPMAAIVFGFSVLVLMIITERGLPGLDIAFFMVIAMVFAQITIGIANEIFDYELDKVTKPWRALPYGYISLPGAIMLCVGAFLTQILFSARISFNSMLFLMFLTGIGVLYSAVLKRSAFSWIAYAIAYPSIPIWVWLSLNKLPTDFYTLYIISFPFVISIHMINQLRDFDDDMNLGVRGFVQYLGKSRATWVAFLFLVLGPLPVMMGLSPEEPILFSILGAVVILHWVLIVPPIYRYTRKPSPKYFQKIFSRLKYSGPLLLFVWIILR